MSVVQVRKSGSGNKGLDWVIILGMIAAYPKTADLLSYFAPQILTDIFGIDMSMPYGMFCAALVEGTILFLHFDRRAHRVASAQAVKWILIGVSFLCQIFDGFITTDTVAQMSPTLRLVLTYGIPALPLIIATMIASIGALPDEDQPVARVGLKHRLPNVRRIWNGDENLSNQHSQDVPQNDLDDEPDLVPSANGKKAPNPTSRRP